MSRLVALVGLSVMALALTGCLEDGGGAPPYGADGIPLVAYGEYHDHSGTDGVHLAPNATEPPAAPASCVAFRNATPLAKDSCDVHEEEEELPAPRGEEPRSVPWTLRAEWEGGVDESAWRVLAFDSENETVAWWDGAFTDFAWYATE